MKFVFKSFGCQMNKLDTALVTSALIEAGFDPTYIEIPGTSQIELIGHDIIDGEFVTSPDEEAVLTVAYAVLEAISSFPEAQGRGQ